MICKILGENLLLTNDTKIEVLVGLHSILENEMLASMVEVV